MVDCFSRYKLSNLNNLKILQWNSRSLNKVKLDELLCYAKTNEIRIISVCETWWEDSLRPVPILKDWNIFTHNNKASTIKKCRGGVALFIHKTIKCERLELNVGSNDIVGSKIYFKKNTCIHIFSCYNAPLKKNTLYKLKEILTNFRHEKIIVMGDFNAKSPSWCLNTTESCSCGRYLLSLCDEFNLVCINNGEPTRYPKNKFFKPSSIDLFFISKGVKKNTCFSIDSDLSSDHRPIICSFKNILLDLKTPREFWNFKKADNDKFQKNCEIIFKDFMHKFQNLSIDLLVEKFSESLLNAAKLSVPVTKETLFRPNSWWNKEIGKIVRKRKRLRKKWQRSRSPKDFMEYKKFNKLLNINIRNSKRNSYRNFCTSLKKETGPLQWKKLRWLTRSNTVSFPTFKIDDTKITNDKEKSEILIEQYKKVSEVNNSKFNRQHKIKVERRIHREQRNEFFKQRNQKETHEVYEYDQEFKIHELEKALQKLKLNAAGSDRVNNWFLKNLPSDILKILLFIYNKSWKQSHFPVKWKIASIIPILKAGKDPTNPKNYRPISLLSCLGKLMERLVYNRLYWIVETCNLLSDVQCGFRKRKSTIEPLIRLTQDIHRGFSTKSHTFSVFLDISKAYDTVWKDGLKFRLYTLGIRGRMLLWITDFLENRKGQVKVNDSVSNLKPLEYGVPQGSVLSTILFILYIDGVHKVIKHCNLSIFADDIALWVTEQNYSIAINKINSDLSRIYNWSQKWRFNLSIEKCLTTVFTRSCKVRENFIINRPIILNGLQLNINLNPRFLGLWFDSRLTWNFHISKIKETVERKLNMLRRIAHPTWGATRSALIILYKSFIRPSIDYGSEIYGSASKSSLKKLDILQNRCLRFITRALPWTNKTILEVETQVESLSDRRDFANFKIMQKLFRQKLDSPLQTLYTLWFNTRHITEYRGRLSKSLFSRFQSKVTELEMPDLIRTHRKIFNDIPPWDNNHIQQILLNARDLEVRKNFKTKIKDIFNTFYQQEEKFNFYRNFKESINTNIFNFENSINKNKIIFRLRSKTCKLKAHSHLESNSFCNFCDNLDTINHLIFGCRQYETPRQILRKQFEKLTSPVVN
ncbi:MAG: RNA-directed DNA polymerase, partial [Flavobacteriaceae bacterium]|nr:RNA-directed DNA polymerase [Flavobacteriaceae bacterium]